MTSQVFLHFCCTKKILIGVKKKILYMYFTSPAPDSSVEAGAELSEIDARLQALQEYMRDLDTGH